MSAIELNLDGIVGPSHHYAGLAHGNVASTTNRGAVSNPRAAALEGLAKAHTLWALGVPQGVLPPHERPDVRALRRLGFEGSDTHVVGAAHAADPRLLSAVSSASSMWTANAATVSPSADCEDGRVHFVPANLAAHLHRSLETETTAKVLRRVFADERHFVHHEPLPATDSLADEGAANHMRFCERFGEPGLELFVYGRDGLEAGVSPGTPRFLPRQSRLASEAVARLNRLRAGTATFVRQEPTAVDAGAFHNDVVSVGHRNLLVVHEHAWVDAAKVIETIRRGFSQRCGGELEVIRVSEAELNLDEAVRCYLFNSQIVSEPGGAMILVAPVESEESPRARAVVDRILASQPSVREVRWVSLRQSMRNGGGPACLRLRVELTEIERAAMFEGVLLDDALYGLLIAWVERNYRDRLTGPDLADPLFFTETRSALDELTAILGLGSIYPFQLEGR